MHFYGLLVWRQDDLMKTPFSRYADEMFMTILAITKNTEHERLIS